MRLKARFLMFK